MLPIGSIKNLPHAEGLVNFADGDEILDLLAYIESTGKERAANFKTVAAE